jgi:hypothetical protein
MTMRKQDGLCVLSHCTMRQPLCRLHSLCGSCNTGGSLVWFVQHCAATSDNKVLADTLDLSDRQEHTARSNRTYFLGYGF